MKKLSSLKLNQLSKAEMEKREMNMLRGGSCPCGCNYMYSGGSSTIDNGNANCGEGKYSYGPYGDNIICF